MTTTYGITPIGFTIKPLDVIVAGVIDKLRDRFGASLNFGSASVEGVMSAIVANAVAEAWEVLQGIVAGLDPDSSTGVMLDAISAITGTFRRGASASTVTLTCTGDATTTIPSGSQVRSASVTATVFATTADVALLEIDAWTISTAYVVGDRVSNTDRSYACITAGTSAGSGGPTTAAADITDGTVHWQYLGEGVAAGDVAATSTVDGPTVAVAGDLSDIVTPVAGWQTATNLLDAVLGRDVMTDEELRILRAQEVASAGNGTPDAIRAALLEVLDVTAATVFENVTDYTDGDGLLPHSIEALVTGGDDQDVIDALWQSRGGGIRTVGSTTGYAVDSNGAAHLLAFSRPTEIPIYLRAFVTVFDGSDPTVAPIVPVYPTAGDDAVALAIVTYGDTLAVGRDAVPRRLGAQAFDVDGVLDVTETLVWTSAIDDAPSAWAATTGYTSGDQITNDGRQYVCTTSGTSAGSGGPSTTGTNITDGTAHWRYLGAPIVITSRQRATFDTSRVAIVSVAGDP